jgi:tryptophan-rich hypothetical protein
MFLCKSFLFVMSLLNEDPDEVKYKPAKSITSPKKLLNSKWTAVKHFNKEKYFMVTQLISPDSMDEPITFIEFEVVHSKRSQRLSWQALNDSATWQQGWA